MEDRLKRMWDGFWKWIDRFWKWIDRAEILGTAVAVLSSAAVAMWSYLKNMPGPEIATLGIVVFAAIMLVTVCLLRLKSQKPIAKDRSSDSDEIRLLIGSWTVRKSTRSEPAYLAVWAFTADHGVTADTQHYHAAGRWHLEPTRVLIQWDTPLSSGEQCYDTFHRPINADNVLKSKKAHGRRPVGLMGFARVALAARQPVWRLLRRIPWCALGR